MSGRRKGRRRRRLWLADPHCHYCGQLTVYVSALPGKTLPWNAATVDHIHPRGSGKVRHRQAEHVLACWYCNMKRADRPYEEFRARFAEAVS